MYIGIGQGPQHQTCTFEICNFHFHCGSNLTSSGIQVKSMQNVNCTLKIVGKYYIKCGLLTEFKSDFKLYTPYPCHLSFSFALLHQLAYFCVVIVAFEGTR